VRGNHPARLERAMIEVEYRGGPGGAQKTITASPTAVDLSAYKWRKCLIWSQDANLRISFAASATSPTLVAEGVDSLPGASNGVAYNIAKGWAVPFIITGTNPFLIVATDTGSGTVKIKPVSAVEEV
jgi:hypothetical protein